MRASSRLEPVVRLAPRLAISSASCCELRVLVPSCSMAAVKPARPGWLMGLTNWPARTTKLALTSGRPDLGTCTTVKPLASVKRLPTGNTKALALPAVGRCLRQDSSPLRASPLTTTVGMAGVATSTANCGAPGVVCTTTLAFLRKYEATAPLTDSGVTPR